MSRSSPYSATSTCSSRRLTTRSRAVTSCCSWPRRTWSTSCTTSSRAAAEASAVEGDQLVARVVDETTAFGCREATGRRQLTPGCDTGERPPTEPHERHRAGPVVELCLEGWNACPRAD